MSHVRREMIECGFYNRANTRYFKNKKKYDRNVQKNIDRLNEG